MDHKPDPTKGLLTGQAVILCLNWQPSYTERINSGFMNGYVLSDLLS